MKVARPRNLGSCISRTAWKRPGPTAVVKPVITQTHHPRRTPHTRFRIGTTTGGVNSGPGRHPPAWCPPRVECPSKQRPPRHHHLHQTPSNPQNATLATDVAPAISRRRPADSPASMPGRLGACSRGPRVVPHRLEDASLPNAHSPAGQEQMARSPRRNRFTWMVGTQDPGRRDARSRQSASDRRTTVASR